MREGDFKVVQPECKSHAGRRPLVVGLIGTLLLTLAMVVAPTPLSARVSVGIFVGFGPPALPVYMQPPCPGPGYMWTPGYWAWDPAYGYYWVPGTWVPAPFIGAMWTPGYWGWEPRGYLWHPGYWGSTVGFYGGINYGFGYTGYGYYGGYWRGGRYFYNREVNHITNVRIVNVYRQRVNVHDRGPRISYNGGRGGINVRPTRQQMAAERGRRSGPVNDQLRQERFARSDRTQRASFNHGRPDVAATRRAGDFRGRDAVRAERAGAPYHGPSQRSGGREFSRPATGRANNDRGFQSFGSSRPAERNARQENRGPVERGNQRPSYSNNQPRSFERNQPQSRPQEMRRVESRAPVERGNQRPTYRNNQPTSFERNQPQSRPQEMRQVESRPAPEQRGNSGRQEVRGGGNGNSGDSGHGGGNHGRGGRH